MTVVDVVQVPEACVASIHSWVPPREERIKMMARMTITATAAAKMQPTVDARVIKERSRRLRQLDEELQARFRAQFVGEKVGIIVEKTGPVRGRSERYFMVEFDEKETADFSQEGCIYAGRIGLYARKIGFEIGFVWVCFRHV